jgi:protein tyrosine/serine phosphatase
MGGKGRIAVMSMAVLLAAACTPAPSPRDPPGVPNFHRVDEGLWRGAQPTAEGFRNLERMGVRTVVNLRTFHSDREGIAGTGLDYEHIHAKAWHAEEEDVVAFLRVATDPARRPVFVHCQHGADRTGLVCAAYRIAVEGWPKERAIREMTEGGFGYHDEWSNLVTWLREMDVARVRREAGIGR